MENIYDDELMPENFEQIARAYSKSMKKKGFVFIRLEEEEFNLLLGEIYVLIGKMKACLEHLNSHIDGRELKLKLIDAEIALTEKFDHKKVHKFRCVEDKNTTFLSLISLENMLVLKLMLLSIKSGELELCNKIITSITAIFADSFALEGFVVEN